jgi:hypothetical protein
MITDQHFHLPKPEPYQRFGSGDGEREAPMTRQMPYEPLPASVLLGGWCGKEGNCFTALWAKTHELLFADHAVGINNGKLA